MAGFWLTSIAWTLPAAKLVLVATLWLRHGRPLGAHDVVALLPELGLAAAIVLAGRATARRRAAHTTLLAATALLAIAGWLACAAWAFAGAPVGLALVARLLPDATTLRTAFADPTLRRSLVGWLGGFAVLWVAVASLVVAARRLPVGPRVSRMALAALALAGVAVVASRPVVPERRLALAVALADDGARAVHGPHDAAALAELAPARRQPRGAAASQAIRNVVILVLESVRFEPGSRFARGFPEALHLDRVYAHHPRSVKTLEALLFGLYPSPPLLSAAWAIDRYDVASIALPRVLAAHGFTSHYLSAMHLGFDNYGGALATAGFDAVETVRDGEALTWGVAAPALFGRVAALLEEGRARGERRLVMAWTAECHLPYDHAGEESPAADPLARYRSCQDALARDVAGLLAELGRAGLRDETLVVVLGDHGQIFASEKANEFGHGTRVYEPSLRVPLLLFVPGVPGGRDARLFQPVDVPPTILGVLGVPVPDAWVGRDLLDADEPGRAFVVALSTLSDGQAAVVEGGGRKLVRSGRDGELVAFDLAADPTEERGFAPDGTARRSAAARIATYEWLAASAWERRRRDEGPGPYAFDAAALSSRWAPGPCLATRLDGDGALATEPLASAFCDASRDPFERRLARAFDAGTFAAGARLSLTLALDLDAAAPPQAARALAKIWGRDDVFATSVDPEVDGYQTVSLVLPGPPEEARHGDTVVAFVGVDPPAPFALREVVVEPLSAGDAQQRSADTGSPR